MDRRNFGKGLIAGAVTAALAPRALAGIRGGGFGRGWSGGWNGGSGAGFYADPYASYATSYIADTTFAGTAGTNTTVSWNGGTVTGPTYSTAQAAISAAAAHLVSAGTSTRVCLLAGQTYYPGASPLYIDSNTGAVATSTTPFVIQGDPAATEATMPAVSGNGSGEGAFAIGSAPAGSVYAGSNDNRNTTVRKVRVYNYNSSTKGTYAFALGMFNTGRYDGFVCEYCKLHQFRNSSTGGEGGGGPFYTFNPNTSDHFTIRYTKMFDNLVGSAYGTASISGTTLTISATSSGTFAAGMSITGPDSANIADNTYIVSGSGTTFTVNNSQTVASTSITGATTANKPFSAIETYGGTFDIHHNEIYRCPTAFSGKVMTPTSPNGNFRNNLIYDCGNSGSGIIEGEAGGEGPAWNGFYIYGNLFCWKNLANSIFGPASSQDVYNDTGTSGNTTAPTNLYFYNNTVSADFGSSGNLAFSNVNTSVVKFHDNVFLPAYPLVVRENGDLGSYALCDYNVYYNPQIFYLNLYGTPQSVASFTAWQSANTTYPTFAGLAANPDTHGKDIFALSSPWNTIAANFPNYASYDYTIASGSPLKGAGTGGADPGYTPTDCGPGW